MIVFFSLSMKRDGGKLRRKKASGVAMWVEIEGYYEFVIRTKRWICRVKCIFKFMCGHRRGKQKSLKIPKKPIQ